MLRSHLRALSGVLPLAFRPIACAGWLAVAGMVCGSSAQLQASEMADEVTASNRSLQCTAVVAPSFGAKEVSDDRKVGRGAVGAVPVPIEDTPPLTMPFNLPESVPAGYGGQFTVDGETDFVILGSTNGVKLSEHAYLDALLHRAYPTQEIRMRNMAWQADTVYWQRRPRYFFGKADHNDGSLDLRERLTPEVIFLWFGQAESLDGPERLDEFYEKYQEVVQLMKRYTGRVVLLTPVPFENPYELPYDLEERNTNLAAYVDAIKRLGAEESLLVVDLFEPLEASRTATGWTRDGLNLNIEGQWQVAHEIAAQLGFGPAVNGISPQWPAGTLAPAEAEEIRALAQHRNLLWFRYWRPTNWAFLYGNRQHVPSSRSHEQRRLRWFPEEIEMTLPALAEAESALHQAVRTNGAGTE